MLPLLPSVTSQVASSHLTLALSPVENWQVLPPEHWALHDPPQVPVQLLLWVHWRSELPLMDQLHEAPALQTHAGPEHTQAGPGQGEPADDEEPQPRAKKKRAKGAKRIDMPARCRAAPGTGRLSSSGAS